MRTRALLPLLHSLPVVAVLVLAGSGALSGPSAELRGHESIRKTYLGY